ncbi:MAG TPA: hypothetical protein VNO79_05585 [Actinomycetota bacterium]|nr:hypothetical protein [Actinomycetota bacterium]
MGVNAESLERANAFLAAVAARVRPGEFLQESPADIGREIGFEQPLVAARAVRALLARRRLEAVDGRYRLVDARPVEPGERETVKRPARARRAKERPEPQPEAGEERVTYSAVGREMVERLIELGREVATLRASLRAAREEAREAREARDEAERRAQTLANRVRELEARADMAETNLRNVLAAARGAGRDVVGDSEMEAILGVLKGEPAPPREPG